MKLDFINVSSINIDKQIFIKIMELLKTEAFLNNDHEICLKLSSEQLIKDYNKKFRGKDKMTDVLSFPNEFKEIPFLGDILIDVNVAENQKGELSLNQELSFLFLHGVLHLLGYDHINANDKTKMLDIENSLRNKILANNKGDN